jgi:hypothetical protein
VTRHSAADESRKGAGLDFVEKSAYTSTVESPATLGARWWSIALVWFVAIGMAVFAACPSAHAQEVHYTPDDVAAAIHEASVDIGVSEAWLYRTVDCETGGTFDPYAIGKHGELGAAQLHPRGELRTFLAWGYSDPFSPYQAVRFMAQEFNFGKSGAWSCS